MNKIVVQCDVYVCVFLCYTGREVSLFAALIAILHRFLLIVIAVFVVSWGFGSLLFSLLLLNQMAYSCATSPSSGRKKKKHYT